MACLWRKKSSGTWCVTYRGKGKQKVRSLRTSNKREAVRLQREIEALLEEEKTAAGQCGRYPDPALRSTLVA